jgi:hypothetical protein
MNDMVSIKKMRPFVSAGAIEDATAVGLASDDDFFLEGKNVSLAAKEFFTTGDTEEHRANQNGSDFLVFLCAPCG